MVISSLEAKKASKFGVYDHLSNRQRAKIVRLVGRKCLVECKLSGIRGNCLWDTGAMVSLVASSWMKQNLPKTPLGRVQELLDEYPGLDLTAANGSRIPFVGWVELNVQMSDKVSLEVPFLVTNGEMEQPLIGFNVVEAVVKEFPECDVIGKMFPKLEKRGVEALVDTIQATKDDAVRVQTTHKDVLVPAGTTTQLRCKAQVGYFEEKTPLLLESDVGHQLPEGLVVDETIITIPTGVTSRVQIPITNTTKHDIMLRNRTTVGMLTTVISVTPLPMKPVMGEEESHHQQARTAERSTEGHCPTQQCSTNGVQGVKNSELQPLSTTMREELPNIDLQHLSPEQRWKAEAMLYEERESFSKDDTDIGFIDQPMSIKLKDPIPVQKRYNSIPKPLYP
jgi:hypothetical protein